MSPWEMGAAAPSSCPCCSRPLTRSATTPASTALYQLGASPSLACHPEPRQHRRTAREHATCCQAGAEQAKAALVPGTATRSSMPARDGLSSAPAAPPRRRRAWAAVGPGLAHHRSRPAPPRSPPLPGRPTEVAQHPLQPAAVLTARRLLHSSPLRARAWRAGTHARSPAASRPPVCFKKAGNSMGCMAHLQGLQAAPGSARLSTVSGLSAEQ